MEPPISFVIGLGNPDEKYRRTPHNIGREFVEWLAGREKSDWRSHKQYETSESQSGLTLVRLKCYMNESGVPISELMQKHSSDSRSILVITDDFDLPLGTIRLRKKGSAGTHNGLKSIIQHLNTQEFPRLRLGVGPLPAGQDAARFVLDRYNKAQESAIGGVYERAAGAVAAARERGVDAAMNEYNAGSQLSPKASGTAGDSSDGKTGKTV